MRTIQELVRAEVVYCVSSLIYTLANGTQYSGRTDAGRLMAQAIKLSAPIADYESAAEEAGWHRNEANIWTRASDECDHANDDGPPFLNTAQEACDYDDIEPHDREVYEHWIVTDWLAELLEAKGEKVDRDFAGMTVWARTNTGQSIEIDSVIAEIHADLVRQYGEEGRANG